MPKRINRAIELLEQGQPIYYTDAQEISYDAGREMAGTWADYIRIETEHQAFDVHRIGEFMRGLVDGGPTRSGHRTPAVSVTIPTDGTSEAVVRANAWMIKQVLAQGVHGVALPHAETPEAVKAFVESCRYSFQQLGVGQGLDSGRRGHKGQASASEVWGLPVQEYLKRADVWPLNPVGEIMLGIKIENRRALENAESSAKVPGPIYGEWGAGDMAMSFGYPDAHDPPYPEAVSQARERVKAALQEANVFFLDLVFLDTVVEMIDEGLMIGSTGPAGEAPAKIGRAHTKRTMPV